MRYEFHPEARAEYLAAVARYEDRQSGLGTRFMIEIEDAIQRVVQAPSRWRNIRGDVRRCLAHKFPYGVLYSVESDHVLVLAIMHYSRKPDYWHHRTD